MKNVLLAGAGKSSSYLIDYLLKNAKKSWLVTIIDTDMKAVMDKTRLYPDKAIPAIIDINNAGERKKLVAAADLVISLLPPHLHQLLAEDCLLYKKNLITSSYLSEDMKKLNEAVKEAGLLFACEMGLDPGIDHMTTASIVNSIKRNLGEILSFKSFCGGIVSPESDNNPWHYKISWNPRNIILAGKAGAQWLENNNKVESNYENLFKPDKKINVAELGALSFYPNRNSIPYIEKYDIPSVRNFVRATLRPTSFMKGWQAVIAMQLTDEDDVFNTLDLTYAQWITQKCNLDNAENVAAKVQEKYKFDKKTMSLLQWLGIFDNIPMLAVGTFSSAQILQCLLEQKWKLDDFDKDMVVMQHEVEYERKGQYYKFASTMIVYGENKIYSAMAKTVGLPIGILAKKILLNQIDTKRIAGVRIPTIPELYNPILKELEKFGIVFKDTEL